MNYTIMIGLEEEGETFTLYFNYKDNGGIASYADM
ncbi:hypothetical protein HNR31_002073 [Anoxybacillus caldiproteolyticus]|uniref:Uncharacterized protein n=1 Tax=Thermaerobacillus caldiproteolyticus TaxID=247480 RepID=A0A7V9Z729_9BACL|nr:hypothetical protein [Anoxybacillus caldiproteolyticus]